MRIAYLTNQYPASSHTFIRREIAALEALGHCVFRFAIRRVSERFQDQDDDKELAKTRQVLALGPVTLAVEAIGSAISRPLRAVSALLSTFRYSRVSKRGLLRHLAYYVEALVIAAWCRREDVAHIHVHFGTNPATVAALVSDLTDIPFSFTVHGPEEFDRPDEYGLGMKIAKASFVAAVSSFGRSQLMRWGAVEHWPKIHVVHCGLDRVYLEDHGEEMGDGKTLLCVARLSEQKGHLPLLQAAAKLRDRGAYFRLVLVGEGPMRQAIERATTDLDLTGIVRIAGSMGQAEVRSQIRLSHAMVLPSLAEGLPVVLMESMALRRPVIATYVAGIPELVDKNSGWLVPAGDVAALCDAMEAALKASATTMRQMGNEARRRVLARHDIDVSSRLIERHILRAHAEGAARISVAKAADEAVA